MENPLRSTATLPLFSQIIPEQHIKPAIEEILAENRAQLTALLASEHYTWETVFEPLEAMQDKLARAWSPVSHLHSVMETDRLRDAYNTCLPLLTEYHTELMQNEKLYHAIRSIADSPTFATLNASQQKIIRNELRDFTLAGVNLSPEKKQRFGELQKELSSLSTQFSEDVLDATQAWHLHVSDETRLAGLSEQDKALAADAAQDKQKSGWVFTLEYPSYSAVMRFLNDRAIRQTLYEAYVTRASELGPNANQWNNLPIMNAILQARHELAQLVGFQHFAEYSLATKMADSSKRVMDFLQNLVKQSKPTAQKELAELTAFAHEFDGTTDLQAWDLTFYTEKLRQQKYAISQEELKPYFPADVVLKGFFTVINRLYGLHVVEKTDVDTWHPQVKFFEVYDEKNQLRGSIYTDLFARAHKRDGAWMDDCRMRRRKPDGSLQYPVAYLTCNFTRASGEMPALLSQDEVETLFHEFGHCLHHILTQIDYASISGINGVLWDAVEFPSQIMEHWCWEKEAIALFSSHYQTGEPLPDTLYKKLHAAKYFQSGLQMIRQLEFSLFDFRIHAEYDATNPQFIQATLDDVRANVSVLKAPAFNRFQNTFSHIFAGGYAAGYYSYKWAEVLSSDAYSLFEERGIFDHETGVRFMQSILEQGGLPDPMSAFVAFRGREPSIEPLLRHSGLAETS